MKSDFFPRILRFITEKPLPRAHILYSKVFVVSFVSGVLIMAIIFQAFSLRQNIQEAKLAAQQRDHLLGEVKYWQQLADKYKNYRDIYYKLAALQYEVGNTQGARVNIQKALNLDPNFAQGRILAEKIEAN